jgi:outer membrane protein TolC
VSAGYRIGRGDFQPWYKERQTNEGGEFKLAFAQSLIRGRAIDPQRVAVFRASLEQQLAAPILQQAILDASLEATAAYWNWIAAGAFLQAQRELTDLAEARGQQFETGVQAGKFAEIDLILNRQLIAERRASVLEAEKKYRAAALKLSLFLRDQGGQPLVPEDDWLPSQFPAIRMPELLGVDEIIAQAVAIRPEPRSLQLQLRQLELDRRLATNQMLPTVDLIAQGSQDVGPPASVINDKGPFQLHVGLVGELPIQRRKAMGKRLATSAKISQLGEKLRLQRDKIGTEVQTALNSLTLSQQIVEQAEISLRTAFESLDRYRFAFERGKVDLIYLNLLETKANETEIKLVKAQQDWFISLGLLQAALGLDPLEQAISVAELPPSNRPGPGQLPKVPQRMPDAQ